MKRSLLMDNDAEPRIIWSDSEGRESHAILSHEDDMARIWQAAMTDWLADRQKGYRKE
jgi:hypothetical protein